MAVLRSLLSIKAEEYRREMEDIAAECYASIASDFCFPAITMPDIETKYVPCREGSLHSNVTRRSYRKQVRCQRWSDR